MDFTWALRELTKGNKVRRPFWGESAYYFIECGSIMISGGGAGVITTDEIKAENWELYKEPTKTLSDKTDNAICFGATAEVCTIEDVKEFIEEIKEELDKKYVSVGKHTTLEYNRSWVRAMCKIIDKFAGDRFK